MQNIREGYKEARWWKTHATGKLLCTLCPRYCTIGEGQKGFCYIRQNSGGRLYSTGYGRPSGFALDPIEKKPLNHFLPGSNVLSFGTAGCNLGCKFCQNWTLSKASDTLRFSRYYSPEQVVNLAIDNDAPSIAYTYNDPTIFGEYVIDISQIARDRGIKNVMVTAGYINETARKDVYKYIDAANVDLKSFSEAFYHKLTFSHLQNVLETLLWIKHETNIWLEITTLLIPGENDSAREIDDLTQWIFSKLGPDVPLHFTAFHPDFKMRNKSSTPQSTMLNAYSIGKSNGLNYIYLGNCFLPGKHDTCCPSCGKPVIQRRNYSTDQSGLINDSCAECGKVIPGIFS